MSEKRHIRPAAVLSSFRTRPKKLLENSVSSSECDQKLTRILLRGGSLNQTQNFFVQKLSNLGPVLNKPMRLKRITEGAWGESLQPLSDFWDFAAKNSDINAISITFRTFLKSYEKLQYSKMLKIQKPLNELNCLTPSTAPYT